MTFAHHDAALGHQRSRREPELVGAEQGADRDIASGLHLAIDLNRDAATKPIQHQGLLRFREAELPRRSRMLDRRLGRRSRSAVVAGNGDVIRLSLGNTRRNRSHTNLGDQLDADRRLRIRIFQIMNQLRQIFDRVDVVMRRRGDQSDARDREPQPGDVFGHLVPGKLPSLARLGALRHLDLQLVGVDKVLRSDAEPRRRYLLDLRAQRVALAQRHIDDDAVDA